ncbi:DUF99 family protein [archaeon]|nr:DUF99 family protein [archaeon]
MIKQELRLLGVDDGPFTLNDERVIVICTVYRGRHSLDGLFSFWVKRDGLDATSELIRAVNKSKHKKQLKIIMIDGVALGGFNIIDLEKVNKDTGLPVIAVINRKPDLKSIKKAVSRLSRPGKRWALIEKLPPVSKLRLRDGFVYYQYSGLSREAAEDVIKSSTLRGKIPEPVRAAHLIAGGVASLL